MTSRQYNFFTFQNRVFSHLNLHFQPLRLLAEKPQPSVRTTWVGLVTSDTCRDTACPACWDLGTQPQSPPHFSFSHSSLGTSIKTVIMCPNKREKKNLTLLFKAPAFPLPSKEPVLPVYLHIPYLYGCSFMIPHVISKAPAIFFTVGKVQL